MKSSLVRSEWLIVNGAIADTGSYWNRNTVVDQSRIGRSERIKRVLDWHTEPEGAKGSTARTRECIRIEWSSLIPSVKKGAGIFKVGKHP